MVVCVYVFVFIPCKCLLELSVLPKYVFLLESFQGGHPSVSLKRQSLTASSVLAFPLFWCRPHGTSVLPLLDKKTRNWQNLRTNGYFATVCWNNINPNWYLQNRFKLISQQVNISRMIFRWHYHTYYFDESRANNIHDMNIVAREEIILYTT